MPTDRLRKDLWVLDARDEADAAARYRAACENLFDITILCPEDEFHNRLEGYNLDGLIFLNCRGVPQRYRRQRSHIVADPADLIQVVLELESDGWTGDYDGRPADRGMGSIRMMEMNRPFDMTTGAFHTLHFVLPRDRLGDAGGLDLHGLVISEDTASGGILGSHLRRLAEAAEHLSPVEAPGVARATADLIASVLQGHATANGDARPQDRALLASARRYIDSRLADPDLNPEEVRAHLAVSRSQLYQAVERVGGVSALIQARRLDRAFDAILADRDEKRTLGEIGYAHGFRSDAHFNRVFRTRFGMPPGRLRGLGGQLQAVGLSIISRPDDVWAWLKSL